MAYTALYRKWRPSCFEDVKGQEPIVRTLQNQIKTGRIAHAYLFCGSRGTGKTTLAKIFARAVNCENPVDGSPCGECDSCKAIASGASMNVFELDAASNNGVDFVRQLLEEIQYPPTQGKYRVYIVDEVHMFSASAFNALLKTLEEPPEYCIFILATTEPHKIPATILSRCQQYDFRRIDTAVIADRLRELAAGEKIEIEDAALNYIARKADGGMRDAISLLDQAAACTTGKLTYDAVLQSIGAVDNETFEKFFDLTAAKDAPGLINMTDSIIMSGRDIMQFARDFTWYLRNMLMVKTVGDAASVDASSADRQVLSRQASIISEDEIMRLIRVYSAAVNEMRQAASRRVIFEITAIRSIRPEADTDTESLSARIGALEQKLTAGVFTAPTPQPAPKTEPVSQAPAAPQPAPEKAPAPGTKSSQPTPQPAAPKTEPEHSATPVAGTLLSGWEQIIGKLAPFSRPCARDASPVEEGDTFYLDYADDFAKDRAQHAGLAADVAEIIKNMYGRDVKVVIRKGQPKPTGTAADIFSVFGNNIEIEGD